METKTMSVSFAAANRRSFLKRSMLGAAGVLVFPNLILPRSAFGAEASPNRRLQIAQIGIGRMGTGDMGGMLKHPQARVVAVCDLDSKRLGIAKDIVEKYYKKAGESAVAVKDYHDYHDVLARPDIDAVVVSVPDHWHALVALEAVLAGKDVYVPKPLTYSILEAQLLRAAVQAKDRILQVGSQQRSSGSFRSATELVRDGHIGKIKTVQIGLGADKPSGKKPAPQPVPENLDYERWLGPAPQQPYMEGRVHPQSNTSGRPGWITTEDFGLGMITNWGAHHITTLISRSGVLAWK
ncbi:MAG: Gfo/Idh/MocA family oxidoreductase [Kiritimatiellaeota bacterium]|nr:Gfo/Idh/MocA family oxidoreductase [Kiritimatiellota bacterium]